MSNESQVVVKILTGVVGSVALLISGVALNNYVDSEKKESEKLDKVYEYILKQDTKIEIHDLKIGALERDILQYNSKVDKIIDNLAESRNQLNEAFHADKKKALLEARQ